jgi:hypothetical protein
MTDDRDRQRSKIYAWEEHFVAPRDPSSIAFAHAQGIVDAIWGTVECLTGSTAPDCLARDCGGCRVERHSTEISAPNSFDGAAPRLGVDLRLHVSV